MTIEEYHNLQDGDFILICRYQKFMVGVWKYHTIPYKDHGYTFNMELVFDIPYGTGDGYNKFVDFLLYNDKSNNNFIPTLKEMKKITPDNYPEYFV
jgi:hypothetical protein